MSKDDCLLLINRIDNDIRLLHILYPTYPSNDIRIAALNLIETLKAQRTRYIEELGQIVLLEMRNLK